MRIFLDHNATTMPSKEVRTMIQDFTSWGNPSSIHSSGRKAKATILKTRRAIAEIFKVSPGEIIFTSGGSESNNFVLKGLLGKLKERGQTTIVSTTIEHPSIMKALEQIEKKEGFSVEYIPVCRFKGLNYDKLSEVIESKNVGLVSIMRANNETGEIFDLNKIRQIIDTKKTEHKIYFHSDMVQALGKLEVDLSAVDFASFSAHKFYALQGTGFIYQKKGVGLEPLISGGGQEKGRRAGTESLLGIAALGIQIEKLKILPEKIKEIESLRDYLEQKVREAIHGVEVMSVEQKRVCNTSLFLIEGVHGETLLINLDLLGFEVSTGAACSSGNPEPSPVLLAMGLTYKEASKSMRVSLGWETTKEEIDLFVEALKKVVTKIRNL